MAQLLRAAGTCAPDNPQGSPSIRLPASTSLCSSTANGDLDKVIDLRSNWGFQNKKGESGIPHLHIFTMSRATERLMTLSCVAFDRLLAVLHVAVAEDHLEIVQYLVAHGAMLNLQDKKHRFTPLMLALAQQPPNFKEIIQALLKGKPDLNGQNSSGQTVVHLAAGASALASV